MEDPTPDIQTKQNEFQKACSTIIPKIDRKLVEDLLYHQQEDPNTKPKYFIEVTTKKRFGYTKIKDLVWSKFGEMLDIDNHGTYYRLGHTLTLEALKQLSAYDYVLNVKGSHLGPYSFQLLFTRCLINTEMKQLLVLNS